MRWILPLSLAGTRRYAGFHRPGEPQSAKTIDRESTVILAPWKPKAYEILFAIIARLIPAKEVMVEVVLTIAQRQHGIVVGHRAKDNRHLLIPQYFRDDEGVFE